MVYWISQRATLSTYFQHRGLPSVKQKGPYPGRGMSKSVRIWHDSFPLRRPAMAGWTPNWKWSSGESYFAFIGAEAAIFYGKPRFLGKTEKSLDFVYPCFAAGYFSSDAEMEGCDWLRAFSGVYKVKCRDTAWWEPKYIVKIWERRIIINVFFAKSTKLC